MMFFKLQSLSICAERRYMGRKPHTSPIPGQHILEQDSFLWNFCWIFHIFCGKKAWGSGASGFFRSDDRQPGKILGRSEGSWEWWLTKWEWSQLDQKNEKCFHLKTRTKKMFSNFEKKGRTNHKSRAMPQWIVVQWPLSALTAPGAFWIVFPGFQPTYPSYDEPSRLLRQSGWMDTCSNCLACSAHSVGTNNAASPARVLT